MTHGAHIAIDRRPAPSGQAEPLMAASYHYYRRRRTGPI
jgi:hypothetical protein